jgi:hypothetical protein
MTKLIPGIGWRTAALALNKLQISGTVHVTAHFAKWIPQLLLTKYFFKLPVMYIAHGQKIIQNFGVCVKFSGEKKYDNMLSS